MASFLLERNRLQAYIETLACGGAHVTLSRKSLNPEVSKIWQGLCHTDVLSVNMCIVQRLLVLTIQSSWFSASGA